jgi:hypothetical protein
MEKLILENPTILFALFSITIVIVLGAGLYLSNKTPTPLRISFTIVGVLFIIGGYISYILYTNQVYMPGNELSQESGISIISSPIFGLVIIAWSWSKNKFWENKIKTKENISQIDN